MHSVRRLLRRQQDRDLLLLARRPVGPLRLQTALPGVGQRRRRRHLLLGWEARGGIESGEAGARADDHLHGLLGRLLEGIWEELVVGDVAARARLGHGFERGAIRPAGKGARVAAARGGSAEEVVRRVVRGHAAGGGA